MEFRRRYFGRWWDGSVWEEGPDGPGGLGEEGGNVDALGFVVKGFGGAVRTRRGDSMVLAS